MTISEIQKKTEIPFEILNNVVNTLLSKKILLISSSSEKNDQNFEIVFNTQFFGAKKRSKSKNNNNNIILPPKKQKSVKIEVSKNKNRSISNLNLNFERICEIEAVIIRIMKSKKKMDFKELCTAVGLQMAKERSFRITPNDLKLRIESLIERDFLQRSYDHENGDGNFILEYIP